ncbi:MAG: GMC family oxidoreductase [Desulfovibrionales bacterium]|nr:MAG: GMC family oxidoreductase [Desulfovibrionales bacterium]
MPLEHFDAIIVGSGFGGAVSAYRLTEAGQQVCVLERGQAYVPGSFPRSPQAVRRNFWDPRQDLFGMFSFWSFQASEALVASGLGGGSLIYANVLIRKPERWFVREDGRGHSLPWPVQRADLEPHYDAVEKILGAQPYPFHSNQGPYKQTPKTLAMRDAAAKLGLAWELPNLAVTFAVDGGSPPSPGQLINDSYPNLHGVERQTCRLCGECDVGCNYGSKNTLDLNYLSLARQSGADLRTLCDVKRIEPLEGEGYRVSYDRHDPNDGHRPVQRVSISAKRLILAAGALGSTYLLLKNRPSLPGLSPALGTRYSTNGDLLAFATQARDEQGGPRRLEPSFGPVITSAILGRDALDPGGKPGERGFYLEDAGYPQIVNWLVEAANVGGNLGRFARGLQRRLLAWWTNSPVSEVSAEVSALLSNGIMSSSLLPLLVMGRDMPDGRMSLRQVKDHQYLDVSWSPKPSRAYFQRVTEICGQVAGTMDARVIHNPLSRIFRRPITVHPLGGCPMGRNAGEGVVDRYGQVFGHPGLFVLDGAVMPDSIGPNPSLTIAAFADFAAQHILDT